MKIHLQLEMISLRGQICKIKLLLDVYLAAIPYVFPYLCKNMVHLLALKHTLNTTKSRKKYYLKGLQWDIFFPPSIWCYPISGETIAGV